ncbi:MAG: hypothetical protein M3Y21_08935 [Candidatus Eremiobacteraeota bacterium]|nr:hypothetical protein [Candidatus Eremiobacteraeota bacterium]
MIELNERTRRISPSRLEEILQRFDAHSIADPFMGVPTHLNYLKRHGLRVHGGDVVEWFVRVGEGLISNDFTVLRDSEVAEIVEMVPGRIYATDMFKAWEGVFFTEEQCIYLGVWHDNVRNLRSDGQTGLAILGLWYVLCYWLQKTKYPDDMQDIPPSELAWNYIRQTDKWVATNLKHNTVRHADVVATISAQSADALFLAPPARNSFRSADARIWMWEAWWQGNPYFNIEHYYRETLFGTHSTDDHGYARAMSTVLQAAAAYPLIIMQTTQQRIAELEPLLAAARPNIEIYSPHALETYLIAKR